MIERLYGRHGAILPNARRVIKELFAGFMILACIWGPMALMVFG